MMAEGWLCDLRGRRVKVDIDFNALRKSKGDYAEADLAASLSLAEAPKAVAGAWAELAGGRQTIVFTPGVGLAYETADALRATGVAAEAIDGAMALDDRRAVLRRYRKKETTVVVNCAVLTEGVDLPETSCIVVAKPTLSSLLYAQMVGRGTRVAPGKEDCLVLDLVGATSMHNLGDPKWAPGPQGLADLVGLEVEEGESVLGAAVADKHLRKELEELLRRHGRLVASDVDLFGRQMFRWLVPAPLARCLTLGGDGFVAVVAGNGGYDVWRLHKEGAAVLLQAKLRIDQATPAAEQVVRDIGSTVLASTSARWRGAPASEAQVDVLAKWARPPISRAAAARLTNGQASDMIGTSKARSLLLRAGLLKAAYGLLGCYRTKEDGKCQPNS
jgi:hypothetical protein